MLQAASPLSQPGMKPALKRSGNGVRKLFPEKNLNLKPLNFHAAFFSPGTIFCSSAKKNLSKRAFSGNALHKKRTVPAKKTSFPLKQRQLWSSLLPRSTRGISPFMSITVSVFSGALKSLKTAAVPGKSSLWSTATTNRSTSP